MELFSEIYGCYFQVIAHILKQSHGEGITKEQIDRIVAQKGFSESALYLIPKLLSGEWELLRQNGDRYYSKLRHSETELPLTALQKSWLKALLDDRRMGLFLDEAQLLALKEQLAGVEPLFLQQDFHVFDAAADGDEYSSADYQKRFHQILTAIHQGGTLLVEYERGKGGRASMYVMPTKLLYSAKDDKFRMVGRYLTAGKTKPVLMNLGRIQRIYPSGRRAPEGSGEKAAVQPSGKRSVSVAISRERNALERCMLQFASYDKQTVYDEAKGRHVCNIFYDPQEETELLIRILSFGPVVEVLEPADFRRQIRERVERQIRWME